MTPRHVPDEVAEEVPTLVTNTIETSVRFRMFADSAPTSLCVSDKQSAAKKLTGVSAWASQLTSPINSAPNGAYGMAAAVRKDHRGARAFEDPV
jgi:hypothetical protein